MIRYVGLRIFYGVLVVFLSYALVFVLLNVLPGDPVELMLSRGGDATYIDPQLLEEMRQRLGYDRPLFVQFFDGLFGVMRGDLGTSAMTGASVSGEIFRALPSTFTLAFFALLIGLPVGVAVAVIAVLIHRPAISEFFRGIPVLNASMPTFWVGLLVMQVLSFQLKWFPAYGTEGWQTLVMPAMTLAVPVIAVTGQVLIKSMDEQTLEPYTSTVWAKGATRARVQIRHVLRNSLIPVITAVALTASSLLAGAVIVETVFSRNGLGRITVTAILNKDIPMVQGIVIVATVLVVLANLLVDLLYPLLDPRIRKAYGK